MAWQDDYDNAARTLLFARERKLSDGMLTNTILRSFCLLRLGGVSYFETLPQQSSGTDPMVTGSMPPSNFVAFQNCTSADSPVGYNPSGEMPVFEMHHELMR